MTIRNRFRYAPSGAKMAWQMVGGAMAELTIVGGVGFKVVVRDDMPSDEVRIYSGNRRVGTIINIGPRSERTATLKENAEASSSSASKSQAPSGAHTGHTATSPAPFAGHFSWG